MIVPKLRAPIVLAHGVLGFGRFKVLGKPLLTYFTGVPEVLTPGGNRVLIAQVSPTGSVAHRAAQLQAFIDKESPREPVHLFAHSMGGLDSRYMISCLGMAGRVLTLTSIGTPHRGSPFADWGVTRFSRLIVPFLDVIGIPYEAFVDLTTARCRELHEKTPDAPGVRYFSVAGLHEGGWHSPEWQLSHAIVTRAEGSMYDGIVSVTSATYGESCEIWQGDHVSLINWRNPISQYRGRCQERTPQYAGLVRRLADEGF